MPPSSKATLVTKAKDLEALAISFEQEKVLAVDTESNSLHAYQEQVCLIQFTSSAGDFLVDPLALDDISVLGKVFASPQIEKIFHASEYDLLVLKRDFSFQFANLFDTMIAARIAGRKRVGLGSLLEAEFGIKLAKRFQRADWGKRPLSPEMQDYARMDTHHLIALREILTEELEKMDRWSMAQEDFSRLPNTIVDFQPEKKVDIWRIKGANDLSPQQAAALLQLAIYRESQAKKADVPLFKIIGDRTLLAIAAFAPRNRAELGQIEGMSNGQIQRHGQQLLSALKRGLQAEQIKRPRLANYDAAYADRLETLRTWRKLAARKMEVESDVILPRDLMEKIAKNNPSTKLELDALLIELPWRRDHYSDEIYQSLAHS